MPDPATQLDPAYWNPPAAAGRVVSALGGAEQARFVGGCVRNALLGIPPGDFDLATTHPPEDVMRRLEQARIKTIPTGLAHGTITAVLDKEIFEITTLRRDEKTDGRHASVSFAADWVADAARRDFTMNTLLADLAGNVADPTGHGLADLHAGRVIFVGNPERRIAEDYLRILRFFRFHALYGRGAPDANAVQACRAAADKITTLSRERITQEILKLLAAADPSGALRLMRDNGILADLFLPAYDYAALARLCALQKQYAQLQMPVHVLARLTFLRTEVLAKYMTLSRAQHHMLESILKATAAGCGPKERLYRFGREAGTQSALLRAALAGVEPTPGDQGMLANWPIPTLPVGGADMQEIGLPPGPQMGAMLRAVETWWISRDFQPDRVECLTWAAGNMTKI